MKNKVPPPIVLLLCGIAAWFLANSKFGIPIVVPFAAIIALLPAAAGLLIIGTAIRQFNALETTVNPLQPEEATVLVDSGIFGHTRNPMYLGLLLLLTAWVIWQQAAGNVAILVLFVVYITEMQIKPEEAALRKIFGQSYVDYCARVRRWV